MNTWHLNSFKYFDLYCDVVRKYLIIISPCIDMLLCIFSLFVTLKVRVLRCHSLWTI